MVLSRTARKNRESGHQLTDWSHLVRSILCTEVTVSSHSQQEFILCAHWKQQTVCPQGQKVAPMGFCLHRRQVMAALSLCSSPSSSWVRVSTAAASKSKTALPDSELATGMMGLTRLMPADSGSIVLQSVPPLPPDPDVGMESKSIGTECSSSTSR